MDIEKKKLIPKLLALREPTPISQTQQANSPKPNIKKIIRYTLMSRFVSLAPEVKALLFPLFKISSAKTKSKF